MSVRRILTLTATVTATLAGVAAAAPQPTLVRVTAPGDGLVVAGSNDVLLGLRRAGGIRITDVAVNGRSIPLRLRRAGARGVRIAIPATRLHRGRNSIWIRSRRGRHTDFDTATVIRTARATGLVRVLRPGAAALGGSTRRATLVVPNRTTEIRVWLNGRPIPASQWEHPWRRRRVALELTASDGMRHGRNQLRVLALGGGRSQVVVREFRVSGTAPLAAPGRHVRTHRGARVRLDATGSRSRPVRGGAAVAASRTYQWELVARPEGSAAEITAPTSAQPTINTDLPGAYRAALVVTDDGGASTPTTVDLVAGHTAPLTITAGINPDGSSLIRVGDTDYGGPKPIMSGLRVIALDRSTGEPIPNGVRRFSFNDPTGAASFLNGLGNDTIVILGWEWGGLLPGPPTKTPPNWTPVLATIGLGETFPDGNFGDVAIGIPGGRGWARNPSAATLSGHLTTDATGELSFVYSDFRRYQVLSDATAGPTNTVTVGDTTYTATLPGGARGGFQVLTLDAGSLALKRNDVFATRKADGSHDLLQMAAMSRALTAVRRKDVVVIAGVGDPGRTILPAHGPEYVGATSSTLARLPNGGRYAFVSSPAGDPIEAATSIQSDPSQKVSGDPGPVQIAGLLARDDTTGAFMPMSGDSVASSAEELAALAFSPSVPWPHSSTPGERAAARWIADRLAIPADDVRAAYVNENIDFASRAADLSVLAYPGGAPGFTSEEFTALTADLHDEFRAVMDLRNTTQNLQDSFTGTALQQYVDVGSIGARITRELTPPSESSTALRVIKVMQVASSVAGLSKNPLVRTALPYARIGLSVGALFAHDVTGRPPADVEVHAGQLAAEVPQRIAKVATGIGVMRDAIVSDHDRLMTAHAHITGGDRGDGWQWNATIAAGAQQAIELGVRRETWRALMLPMYRTLTLDPSTTASAQTSNGALTCSWYESTGRDTGRLRSGTIYADLSAPRIIRRDLTPRIGFIPETFDAVTLVRGEKHFDYQPAIWATDSGDRITASGAIPTSMANDLFAPVTGPGTTGLGIYPPAFMGSFPRVTGRCLNTRSEAKSHKKSRNYDPGIVVASDW